MNYFFRGVEGITYNFAFQKYFQSRLDYWKIDIWQLGTDDMTSEWNSMRFSLRDCNCRGRMDINPESEIEGWPFFHSIFCLKRNKQKIEEFAAPNNKSSKGTIFIIVISAISFFFILLILTKSKIFKKYLKNIIKKK